MKISGAIQESALCLMAYDDKGIPLSSLLSPTVFDPYYREIAGEVSDYISRYGTPPGEHMLDIIEAIKARFPDRAETYQSVYESMEITREGVNADYVLDNVNTFVRFQRLRGSLATAVDSLEAGDVAGLDAAEAALRTGLESTVELFDPGTVLHDPTRAFSFLDEQEKPFATGIEALDKANIGPGRGRLAIMAALAGRGKSWFLTHLAKTSLMRGLRVLYVSLEMSEAEVSQRMYQSLFAVAKRKVTVPRAVLTRSDKGVFLGMDFKNVKPRMHLEEPDIRKKLTAQSALLRRRPKLIVKQFPTSSLTVEELEGYLQLLETTHGFIPDLILVDYADLMKTRADNYRLDIGEIYKKLRGLAIKRHAAVVTASQLNRDALKGARTATEGHLAEDFSKAATADVLITYNQTQAERDLGLARLYVAKGRSDADKFELLVVQAYAIGQFCLDSVRMASDYWDQLKQHTQDEEDEDDQF